MGDLVAEPHRGAEGADPAAKDASSGAFSYLSNQEDVIGSVALCLHLASLVDDPKQVGFRDLLSEPGIFNAHSCYSNRLAAERIVEVYCKDRDRERDRLDKSTDPMFLLMKSEFQNYSSGIGSEFNGLQDEIVQKFGDLQEQILRIRTSLSFRHQVLIAAVAGIIVTCFIFLEKRFDDHNSGQMYESGMASTGAMKKSEGK